MIHSFDDAALESFWYTDKTRRIPADISGVLKRKLDQIYWAGELNDLRQPPGNHLEALKNNLTGCHSIRVNRQWRLVFRWEGDGAYELRLMDYH